jgi:hypothetical protein
LHTKREWKDAQAKCESAEAASASAHRAALNASHAAAPATSKEVSESPKLKLKHQDRPQEQIKKSKEESASAAGKKRAGTEAASQVPASAVPAPVKKELHSLKPTLQRGGDAGILYDRASVSSALPVSGSDSPPTYERNRRLGSDRGNAAQNDASWLRDLTRPLSPFSDPGEMMNRNKDLAAR